MIPAKDISRWQGAWQDTGEPIVLIKIGGGDQGLYYDSAASSSWNGVVKAGKAVGGYWFAGWTNPIAEASYFLKGMQPLTENDVYALDCEAIPAGVDPVAWAQQFTQYVHDQIGVWCLVYMNLSTLQAHDWHSVLNNCGLWLADWNNNPAGTISTSYAYVMQQYADGPVYDHDEWFGTIEQFKAYGYHAPVSPAPAPEPAPEPIPTPGPTTTTTLPPDPTTTTTTTLPPLPEPSTTTTTLPPEPVTPPVKKPANLNWLLALIAAIIAALIAIIR